MTDTNTSYDLPADIKPEIPSGINVLTILSFIGCAFGFFGAIYQFAFAKRSVEQMEEMVNSGKYDQMPAIFKKMYSPDMIEVARKGYENRAPLALLALLSVVLCFIGCLQMRKLRKQGYFLYVAGEVLPLISTLVFLGTAALTGFVGILSIVFVALFIALYSGQRKHLINK